MEYQAFVWSLLQSHRPDEVQPSEGESDLQHDQLERWLKDPLLDEGSQGVRAVRDTGGATPAGEVFVVVSRSTLERLGVWRAVEPMAIGVSVPTPTGRRKTARYSMDIPGAMHPRTGLDLGGLYASYVTSLPTFTGCKLIQAGTLHKRSSPHDPWAHAPLVLAMEKDLFFGTCQASKEANHQLVSASGASVLDAFKRVTTVLEGLVRQDPEPEVMGVEDSPYELLDAKAFAERMKVTDQTIYNQEKAGRLISVLSPGRERGRRFPSFQLSTRLNRDLHQNAISMYRSRGEDMTLYWDFLRTRHEVFGGSTGVDFLLNRVANPALQDLAPDDLAALFLEAAEEDLHRATS